MPHEMSDDHAYAWWWVRHLTNPPVKNKKLTMAEFNVSEQNGIEIHRNLACFVQNVLKGKPEEDRLNQIKKRYLRQKKCEMLAETRVNLPIWSNLSEKACKSDLKLWKVQKSLIKGTTAVVQVVNDLISKPDLSPKEQTVNRLMDGVPLIANVNMGDTKSPVHKIF